MNDFVKDCFRRKRDFPCDIVTGAWSSDLVIVSIETRYLRKLELRSETMGTWLSDMIFLLSVFGML